MESEKMRFHLCGESGCFAMQNHSLPHARQANEPRRIKGWTWEGNKNEVLPSNHLFHLCKKPRIAHLGVICIAHVCVSLHTNSSHFAQLTCLSCNITETTGNAITIMEMCFGTHIFIC